MKRAILLLAAVLVLVCGYLLWWRQPASDAGLSAVETEAAGNVAPVSVPPAAETNSVSKVPSLEKPVEFTDEEWRWALELRERTLAQNSPFVFHAHVADQQGQPVVGARLGITLTRVDEAFFATTNFLHRPRGEELVPHDKELFSDAQGWFRLTNGTGTDLRIESLSKEGYLWTYPSRVGIFGYAAGTHQTSTAAEQTAFDPSQGFPLHLWKMGPTEPLVAVDWRISFDRTQPNGEWVTNYWLSFFRGPLKAEQAEEADLIIHTSRHRTGNPDRPYYGLFSIELTDGILSVTDDPYPYSARFDNPAKNYAFKYDPSSPRDPTVGPWRRTFYVKVRNGKLVGGFSVAFQQSGFAIQFTGHLSPAGSPNLEPDPAKLITDEAEIRRLDEATPGR